MSDVLRLVIELLDILDDHHDFDQSEREAINKLRSAVTRFKRGRK